MKAVVPGGRRRRRSAATPVLVAVVLVLLAAAAAVAWRTWGRATAGPFDPVNAVIATAALAATLVVAWAAVRGLRQADSDPAVVASRLAVAVRRAEERERRQLLGASDRAIDVRFMFRPAGQDAAGAAARGSLAEVAAYYRRLRPRRLVITGAAGSGKTVLAIGLMLDLLAGRGPDDPVPVRLSAAALDLAGPEETLVERWLAGQLERAYGLSRAAAAGVVAARLALPVLDGLDEMDPGEEPGYGSRAARVVRAANAYLDGPATSAMVLTCRTAQYQALAQASEWIRDAAWVQVQPVRPAQARQFLAKRVSDLDRWQPVLDAIARPGTVLARALSTPWRLAVAAVVYESRDPATGRYARDPAELAGPDLASPEAVRDHLLGLFVPAAVRARGGYAEDRVRRWLTVLAAYLDANARAADAASDSAVGGAGRVVAGRTLSGTDLVLHELWPLAGRAPRVLTAALMAAIWVGLAIWLLILGSVGSAKALIFVESASVASGGYLTWWAWRAWRPA